jgi:GntR family transcriptional regulator
MPWQGRVSTIFNDLHMSQKIKYNIDIYTSIYHFNKIDKEKAELILRELTSTEGIPHYVRIRESLREQIASGLLERGQKLPAEDELASQFGVSRMTVRQGIADLIDDGLLYRRHGVGTFVAFPHIERDHSRLTNFFESSINKGVQARACVLAVEVLPAKQKVAKALEMEEGELVIQIKTLRYADEIPVTVHDAYIPHKIFSGLLKDNLIELEVGHLWTIFESFGYRVKSAVQKLEAREADEETARLMEIEVGAPILYKERTVYTDEGMPVEFTYCYNRGDRYSLTVTLHR